ncbi:MAG TPA: hypothetical protein VJC10_01130 [Patescibacteria group bacterium]|nr:hypothetical protein [Patescibacteria group bacterium]
MRALQEGGILYRSREWLERRKDATRRKEMQRQYISGFWHPYLQMTEGMLVEGDVERILEETKRSFFEGRGRIRLDSMVSQQVSTDTITEGTPMSRFRLEVFEQRRIVTVSATATLDKIRAHGDPVKRVQFTPEIRVDDEYPRRIEFSYSIWKPSSGIRNTFSPYEEHNDPTTNRVLGQRTYVGTDYHEHIERNWANPITVRHAVRSVLMANGVN